MSGPSKISLAIALALIGGNAFALGLGSIQVKSGLNQPLDAEIAVTTDSPAEAAGLNVGLATAEDFERVGLSRARVTVPIDFAVVTGSNGRPVIKLTTKDIVREPFLDFLVQVNWPKGKLLREYTVLLDPPVAPAVRSAPATVAPAKENVAAAPQRLNEEKASKPKATPVKPPKSAATEPKQPPAAKAPAAPSTAKTASGGDYGPVAEGETLSEVARATRPDDATNLNQMMLALLKANPNAFYKDNINALKRGAILRIPSNDDLKATGTAVAAAAAVRDQNEAWGSGAAVAKPTLVANAGAPKSPTTPTPSTPSTAKAGTPKPGEHLALVPPRSGKESQATADRPGASTGTSASADSKAELSRTKEALASREQESADLKSRVKQLEDLNTKDQRLLTMKDSEIAELQAKLKDLQSKPGSAATTPTTPAKSAETTATTTPAKPGDTTKPADTTAKPENKLTAQDIWGNIAAEKGNKPNTPSATTTPSTTPSATSTTPATGTASTTTPSSTPSATPSTTSTTPSATSTTPSSSSTAPATTASTTPSTTTPSSTTTATGTTVSPVTSPTTSTPTTLSNPSTSSSTASTSTPAKPATTATKPVVPPPPPEQPWYQNSTMMIAAGGAALLVVGLLLLMRFMRKPKTVLEPIGPGAEIDEGMPLTGEEEHHLLDALAQNPGDPHLSLELLRLYYGQRDAGKFEAAAEAMYAHIADPTQPEWQEVKAMGSDLCPHNPLFSSGDAFATGHHQEHTVFGNFDEPGHAHDEFDLGGHAHETKAAAAEDNFDFDLTDHSATTAAPVEDLSFEPEPLPARPAPAPAPAPVAAPRPAPAPAPAATVAAPKPADDFFAGEDAIGTKLDLAKAYLDMGDPEGARSMLDEVMAEGNDSQKGEARKLLAEIR